jgi:hypothetical protein
MTRKLRFAEPALRVSEGLEHFDFHVIYPQELNQPWASSADTIPKASPTEGNSSSGVRGFIPRRSCLSLLARIRAHPVNRTLHIFFTRNTKVNSRPGKTGSISSPNHME